MKNWRYILGTAFLTMLLIILLSSCSATDKFEDCVAAGNYADAVSIYQEKISGNVDKEHEAQDFMWSYIGSTLSDYAEGQIDTKKAESAFGCISKINSELSILGADFNYLYDEFQTVQLSKENYEKAVTLAEQGDYKGAIALFAKVTEVDTEHYDAANEQLQTVRDAYKADVSEKMQSSIEAGEYDSGINLGLEAIACLGGNDVDLQNLINLAYYEKADDLIDGYINEGKLGLAIQAYQAFADLHSDLVTTDLSEKISVCEKDFVDQVIETSKKLYFEDGAEAALKEIKEKQSLLVNDKLDALYELYQSALAQSWKDITHYIPNSGVATNFSSASDYYGNVYQGDLIKLYTFWMYEYPPLEIIPNKKYTNFAVTLFPDSDFREANEPRLKIYGDDILVYDSGNIEQKTKAVKIDIDITSVEVLKIDLTDKNGNSDIWLQDATFYRKLTEDDIKIAIQ